MSSPKFEADVGEEVEFAERIRLNEGSKHCYVNGHGNDIAEDEWVKANNNQCREWHSGHWDYRVSHEERQKQRDENYAKVQKEYFLTRAEFQKGLTWL